jgi:hypothetical protein
LTVSVRIASILDTAIDVKDSFAVVLVTGIDRSNARRAGRNPARMWRQAIMVFCMFVGYNEKNPH